MNGADERPVVGLFGAFDTGELGEVALRRVLEFELAHRRPDIELVALAPFGADRPIPGDEGRPARPVPSAAAGELLGLDALIIAGDVLGDDEHWASRYPVALDAMAARGAATFALAGARGGPGPTIPVDWFAVGAAGGDVNLTALEGKNLWARDSSTQERLGGTAVQSGDPVLLAGRVFAAETLRRRADLLRLCGALPTGRRVAVEVSPAAAGSTWGEELAVAVSLALRADPKLSIVVFRLDPGREPSIDSLLVVPGLVAERVHRLPEWVGLDDIAAAMSGSSVLATTPAGAHLAAALGVPVSAIDTGLGHRFDAVIPLLAGDLTSAIHAFVAGNKAAKIEKAVQTLDAAFAELAERLPRSASSLPPAVEAGAVQSALTILQARLVDERSALQAELSRLEAELEHLRASPEHRIARPIREVYRRWQRRRT